MPDREDENQQALKQVAKTTESEPVRGQDHPAIESVD